MEQAGLALHQPHKERNSMYTLPLGKHTITCNTAADVQALIELFDPVPAREVVRIPTIDLSSPELPKHPTLKEAVVFALNSTNKRMSKDQILRVVKKMLPRTEPDEIHKLMWSLAKSKVVHQFGSRGSLLYIIA